MATYMGRRLGSFLLVVIGAPSLVFLLVHVIPGDPAALLLGEGAQPSSVQELRRSWGLDRPLAEQYLDFLRGLTGGRLGTSWVSGAPVGAEIAARLPYTAALALSSMLVAVALAVPLGVWQAVRQGEPVDLVLGVAALVGVSIPNFWLGPLLILWFSIGLGWFPVSGADSVGSVVLPALTLGTAYAAMLTRMTRSSVLDELHLDYVRAARAKGAGELRLLFRHVLRNALLPVLTVAGLEFGALLTGSIVTEEIFGWPGVGRYLIHAVRGRDYPAVQGVVVFFAAVYVTVNFLTDLGYGLCDPRLRRERP
jgi:peptide/nickel transport system permease protein